MNLAQLGVRNVVRNRLRASLTVVGSAIAILSFLSLRSILDSWNTSIEASRDDHLVTTGVVRSIVFLPIKYINPLRAIPGIRVGTFSNQLDARDPLRPEVNLYGVAADPGSYLEVYDDIIIPPEEKAAWQRDRDGVILSQDLAKQFGSKVGDRFKVTPVRFAAADLALNVRGIYHLEDPTARPRLSKAFIYHWERHRALRPDRRQDNFGFFACRIDDPANAGRISRQIDTLLGTSGTETQTVSEKVFKQNLIGQFGSLISAISAISFVALLVLVLVLGNTIALSVRERTNSYGVLRAIGFVPRQIIFLILCETAALGLFGGLLGVALAYPFVKLGLTAWLSENLPLFPIPRLLVSTAAMSVLFSVMLSAVASVVPALRISKLPVTEALRRVD